MDLEQQVAEALKQELQRQADEGSLKMRSQAEDHLHIDGDVDLAALAMAVVGHVAGGP